MADLKKYSFNKYSEKYKQLFNREKSKLRKIFPKSRIEHIGSTSIPGLGGKGIIDIAIKTPRSKLKQFIRGLEKIGYKHNSEHPLIDERAFLKRRIKYKGKERTVHVHLTLDNRFWDSFIIFRDHLRNNDQERDKYAKIKKEGARRARGDAKKYRKHKNAFLENIQKLALKKK